MSGCYGDGYTVSAAVCGEGTIYVCPDAAGCADADACAYTFAKFALASANINTRSCANADSNTSH
jgi:hypothetical protein